MAFGVVAGCASPRTDATFARYDDVKEVKTFELARMSQSWDGAELPDYPVSKPELIVKRYVFPSVSKLGWPCHPVMNYGLMQQGELTIVGADGRSILGSSIYNNLTVKTIIKKIIPRTILPVIKVFIIVISFR